MRPHHSSFSTAREAGPIYPQWRGGFTARLPISRPGRMSSYLQRNPCGLVSRSIHISSAPFPGEWGIKIDPLCVGGGQRPPISFALLHQECSGLITNTIHWFVLLVGRCPAGAAILHHLIGKGMDLGLTTDMPHLDYILSYLYLPFTGWSCRWGSNPRPAHYE